MDTSEKWMLGIGGPILAFFVGHAIFRAIKSGALAPVQKYPDGTEILVGDLVTVVIAPDVRHSMLLDAASTAKPGTVAPSIPDSFTGQVESVGATLIGVTIDRSNPEFIAFVGGTSVSVTPDILTKRTR